MSIVTRFAPSPTGFLHIGGARTALFNWLHAQRHGGRYTLRIEDTDRKRSTPEAVAAIIDGLEWLNLLPDEQPVYQFTRRTRHQEVAHSLLASGHAYHCYCSQAELEEMRMQARHEGRPWRYDGRWRHRDPADAPPDINPVIRFKAPQEGTTVIQDLVQGRVNVANDTLDDMILLRADGTPTYMLSVVVDDHDMGVTDIIRGDDHLTNSFRQIQLFQALDWPIPRYGHIPLLHGADGRKLSKRHGALGVGDYRKNGYLPEALNNYLLRLGWAHGDDEIISRQQAEQWFDIRDVGRSAARFDQDKLDHLNGHYLRAASDIDLTTDVIERLEIRTGKPLAKTAIMRLERAMAGLKLRARRLDELTENAMIYVIPRPIPIHQKAVKILNSQALDLLRAFKEHLEKTTTHWAATDLEEDTRSFAQSNGLTLGKLAPTIRAALTGRTISPPIFEVMDILGKAETLSRFGDMLNDK